MSDKTKAELKEQIKIMNDNYAAIKEMHERGYQYSVNEIKKLQTELERTRKALDVAVDALGYYASENSWDETNRWMFVEMGFEFAKDVLDKITATLENQNGNC